MKRFSRGRRSYYLRTLSDELPRARAVVEKAAAGVAAGGIEVETEILDGKPADRIAELARSRGVDLIIVGSCDRGSIVGAFLGSVSEAVVHSG